MSRDGEGGTRTLGRRLARQARRLADRRQPAFPWARQLGLVLERMTPSPESAATRFRRIEASGTWAPEAPAHLPVLPLAAGEASAVGPAEAPLEAGARRREQVRPVAAETDLRRSSRPPAGPELAPGRAPAAGADDPGGPGGVLPADVRARLRATVGAGAEAVRVRQGAPADAIARAHGADAVTLGSEVLFRHGRYRPYETGGFALLAHEATHALAGLRPDGPRRRATAGPSADEAEEQQALAVEQEVLGWRGTGGRALGVPPGRALEAPPERLPHRPARPLGPPAPHASPASPAAPAARPMAAPAGRQLEPGSGPGPAARASSATSDLEALRRTLYHDLLAQIRTEFERGG